MIINEEEIKRIGVKVKEGTATKEELEQFLRAINELLIELKGDIKKIKEN